jgi:hypothetical protein
VEDITGTSQPAYEVLVPDDGYEATGAMRPRTYSIPIAQDSQQGFALPMKENPSYASASGQSISNPTYSKVSRNNTARGASDSMKANPSYDSADSALQQRAPVYELADGPSRPSPYDLAEDPAADAAVPIYSKPFSTLRRDTASSADERLQQGKGFGDASES